MSPFVRAKPKRLEEVGQEAIQARMDPRILRAEQQPKALEDGALLDEDDVDYDVEEANDPHDREGGLGEDVIGGEPARGRGCSIASY